MKQDKKEKLQTPKSPADNSSNDSSLESVSNVAEGEEAFESVGETADSKQGETLKESGLKKVRALNGGGTKISGVIFVFLIAFGLIVLSIGVKYASELITESVGSSGTQITDWKFVWGAQDSDINGEITLWKQATAQKKVKKLAGGKNYLRLNYTLSPLEKSKTLELNTNYSPVKVVLDGDVIYNNGYGKSEFVGNMSCRVKIPSSPNDRVLDIYVYVPTHAAVTAQLTPTKQGFGKYLGFFGIGISIVIFAAGMMMIFSSLLISLRNTYLGKMFVLGVTVMVAGTSLFINQAAVNTAALANPVFYKLRIILDICTAFLIVICSYSVSEVKRRSAFITVSPIFMLASFGLLFINKVNVINVILFVYVAVLLAYAALTFMNFAERLEGKLKYSYFTAVAFVYVFALSIYNIICSALGYESISGYFYVIAILLFGAALYSVFFKQSINKAVRLQEREEQSEKNNEWSKKLAKMFAELFGQKDSETFVVKSAGVIKNMVEEHLFAYADHSVEISKKLKEGIRICAAVADAASVSQVYSAGEIEQCDYAGIIEQYTEAGKKVFLAENSFNFVVVVDKEVKAIFHCENIANGLTPQFKNLVHSMQSNIELIYNNFALKTEMVMTQENIFVALAQTVESISRGSKEHLNSVKGITRILCDQLGFSEKESTIVAGASVAHDIGKIAIPERILQKDGKLTKQEMEMMKRHVIYGYNILSQSRGEFMVAAAVIAYQHHERYDGTGYLGISGEQIHIYARIVAVADVFDALLSKRTYKDPWPPEEVYKYLNDRSGTEFDPAVIKAFDERYEEILQLKLSTDVAGKRA